MSDEFKLMHFIPSNLLYDLPSGIYMFKKKFMWKYELTCLIWLDLFLARLKLYIFFIWTRFQPELNPTQLTWFAISLSLSLSLSLYIYIYILVLLLLSTQPIYDPLKLTQLPTLDFKINKWQASPLILQVTSWL